MDPRREQVLKKELAAQELLLNTLRADELSSFVFTPMQMAFINCLYHFVAMTGGNQIGKSIALRALIAFHDTGRYPEWYLGPRYDRPVTGILAGKSGLKTRDILTNQLLGPIDARGTGIYPADSFDPKNDIVFKRGGEAGQIDYYRIKHKSGGYSKRMVRSFDMGRKGFEGDTVDFVDLDEEPGSLVSSGWPVFDECFQRVKATNGYVRLAFSPKFGLTQIFRYFRDDEYAKLFKYTIRDATWLSEERQDLIIAREKNNPMAPCTLWGEPVVGSGLVFPHLPSTYTYQPQDLPMPDHWPAILGTDFPHTNGKFGGAKLVKSPEEGKFFCSWSYRSSGLTLGDNCRMMISVGGGSYPVSWPHDGGRSAGSSTIRDRCAEAGLNMMPVSAHMMTEDGKQSRDTMAATNSIAEALTTGHLKISTGCMDLLAEMLELRQENGKLVRNQPRDAYDAFVKCWMSRDWVEQASIDMDNELLTSVEDYDFYSLPGGNG